MSCPASDLEFVMNSTGILTVTLVDEEEVAINDATVEVTLFHEDGVTEVSGESWPVTMNYVALSEGEYTVEITAGIEVELNEVLRLAGVATGTDGKVREFKRKIPVVEG